MTKSLYQWLTTPYFVKLQPIYVYGQGLSYMDLNYELGAALYETRHPEAKAYHKLSQAGKEKFRKAFQRRGESTHPHMAKHRAAWAIYQNNVRIAEVTKKLSGQPKLLEPDWP